MGKISPPVYLTNEWVGYNALSEIFWDDWLIPAPVIQQPEEDGDYVELYDAGANTDGDEEASNDAYEDNYDHVNGHDDLNNQVDQANVCEVRGDGDYNDESLRGIDDNLGAVTNGPRLVCSVIILVAYEFRTIDIFGLFFKCNIALRELMNCTFVLVYAQYCDLNFSNVEHIILNYVYTI